MNKVENIIIHCSVSDCGSGRNLRGLLYRCITTIVGGDDVDE